MDMDVDGILQADGGMSSPSGMDCLDVPVPVAAEDVRAADAPHQGAYDAPANGTHSADGQDEAKPQLDSLNSLINGAATNGGDEHPRAEAPGDQERSCRICGCVMQPRSEDGAPAPSCCAECELVSSKCKARGIDVDDMRQAVLDGTFEELRQKVGPSGQQQPAERDPADTGAKDDADAPAPLREGGDAEERSQDSLDAMAAALNGKIKQGSDQAGADVQSTPVAAKQEQGEGASGEKKRCGICNLLLPMEEFKLYGRSTCSYCIPCDRLRCCKKYKGLRLEKLKQGVQSGRIDRYEAVDAIAASPAPEPAASPAYASAYSGAAVAAPEEPTAVRTCYLCHAPRPESLFVMFQNSRKATVFCGPCDRALRDNPNLDIEAVQAAAQRGRVGALRIPSPYKELPADMLLAPACQRRRCNLCLQDLSGDNFQVFPSGSVSSYCVPCEHLRRVNKKMPVNMLREALRDGTLAKGGFNSVEAPPIVEAPPPEPADYREPEWAGYRRAALNHSCADAIGECMRARHAARPPALPCAAYGRPSRSAQPEQRPPKRKQIPLDSLTRGDGGRAAGQAPPGFKLCNLCEVVLPEHDFKLNKRGAREAYCSSCERLRSRAFIRGVQMAELRTMVRLTSVDSVNDVLDTRPRVPMGKNAAAAAQAAPLNAQAADEGGADAGGADGDAACAMCLKQTPAVELHEVEDDGKVRLCTQCITSQDAGYLDDGDLDALNGSSDEWEDAGGVAPEAVAPDGRRVCRLCSNSFDLAEFMPGTTKKSYSYCHSCRLVIKRAQPHNIKVSELRDAMLAGTLDDLLPRKRKYHKPLVNSQRAGGAAVGASGLSSVSYSAPGVPPASKRPLSGAAGAPPAKRLSSTPPVLMSQSVLMTPPPDLGAAAFPAQASSMPLSFTPRPPAGAGAARPDWRLRTSLAIAEAAHPAMFGHASVHPPPAADTQQADKPCAMCGLLYTWDFFKRAPCGKVGYCMMCERLRSRANNKKVQVALLREAMATGALQELIVSRGIDWHPPSELAAIAQQMSLEERRAADAERRRLNALTQRRCEGCSQLRAAHLYPSPTATECKRCVVARQRLEAAQLLGPPGGAAAGPDQAGAEAPGEGSRRAKRIRRCAICELGLPATEFRVTPHGVAEWCNQCTRLCERAKAMELTPEDVSIAVRSGTIEFLLPP